MLRKAGLTLCCLCLAASAAAAELDVLRNNPFRQPPVVKAPPPPPPARVSAETAEPELRLSATMVSPTTPMVVVNGELLGLGERVDGLRLVAVEEGRATFERGGREFVFELAADRPTE